MYVGPKSPDHSNLPSIPGEALTESFPELWQQMSDKYYGQFHHDSDTYVFIKVKLTNQYETKRELYLVSYISDTDVAAHFAKWRQLLVAFMVIMTGMAAAGIVLIHLYRLEQRSRMLNIELSRGLFNTEAGWIIAGDSGRIIKANRAAAQALKQDIDALEDRNLQWALQLDEHAFLEVNALLNATGYWQEELDLSGRGGRHSAHQDP